MEGTGIEPDRGRIEKPLIYRNAVDKRFSAYRVVDRMSGKGRKNSILKEYATRNATRNWG